MQNEPNLDLTDREIESLVFSTLNADNNSYDFESFCVSWYRNATEFYPKNKIVASQNTTPTQTERAKIREIIWNLIVERKLTLGSYYHDNWPHFSITKKGKEWLNTLK